MKLIRTFATALAAMLLIQGSAFAADKPNIVFIMGDDIGMWNISAYSYNFV